MTPDRAKRKVERLVLVTAAEAEALEAVKVRTMRVERGALVAWWVAQALAQGLEARDVSRALRSPKRRRRIEALGRLACSAVT